MTLWKMVDFGVLPKISLWGPSEFLTEKSEFGVQNIPGNDFTGSNSKIRKI